MDSAHSGLFDFYASEGCFVLLVGKSLLQKTAEMCQRAVLVIVICETKAQSYGKREKKMLGFREWSHVRRSNTCSAAHGGL